jgi:hypothetical protein
MSDGGYKSRNQSALAECKIYSIKNLEKILQKLQEINYPMVFIFFYLNGEYR